VHPVWAQFRLPGAAALGGRCARAGGGAAGVPGPRGHPPSGARHPQGQAGEGPSTAQYPCCALRHLKLKQDAGTPVWRAAGASGCACGAPLFPGAVATAPHQQFTVTHHSRLMTCEQQGQLEAEVAAREASAAEPKPGDKRPAGWDIASMAPKQKVHGSAGRGRIAA
jgi:hypothetical protein